MPQFKINFDEIPDNVVPEGDVDATITAIELRTSKANKPYLNWEFTVSDGDYQNSKIWMITSLAENALFRLKQIAEQLGFEGQFDLEIDEETNKVVYPDLEGTAVTLEIYHEEYEGRKTARIAKIKDYHTTHHLAGEGSFDGSQSEEEFEDLDVNPNDV